MAPVTVEMTDFIDEETNPGMQMPSDVLVADALQDVMNNLPSPCSRRAYSVDWNRWSEWLAGERVDPLDVTPKIVTRHIVWMRDEKTYKRSTIGKALTSIRQVYGALVNAEVLKNNPAREVKRPNCNYEIKTPLLNEEQVRKLLDAQPRGTWRYERDWLVLLTLFGLGFRRAEVARLRIDNFEDNVVTVLVKRAKYITVAVPDWLLQAIADWRVVACIFGGPLFPREPLGDEPISGPIVYDIVKRAAARAGFQPEQVTPHAFRRTFVTLSGEKGISLKARQLAVGHDSSSVTERYDHARDARRAAPGNAFAEIVGAA
jgi:integrase/recombinase XerD